MDTLWDSNPHYLGLFQVINNLRKVADPLEKYQDLFNSIEKQMNMTVKLHINKAVKPVALRHRRIPFHP